MWPGIGGRRPGIDTDEFHQPRVKGIGGNVVEDAVVLGDPVDRGV